MLSTDAWVLHQGPRKSELGRLQHEQISFSEELGDEELLVEPLYGCWEANMTHAISRSPVDVCRQRREERVVLGNAGVVRVLKAGANVRFVKEGDVCALGPNGTEDPYGNTLTVVGYDAHGTLGMLAKRIKLTSRQVLPLPKNSKYSLPQWAAFSLKFFTAWANWKVAHGALRLQMSEDELPQPNVCAWGGGVSLAELMLAKYDGCKVALIASKDARLKLIRESGVEAINRRNFLGLDFQPQRYETEHRYKMDYLKAEKAFLQTIRDWTGGAGVNIFIDNIGEPVFRATLRTLAGQGVVATCGWKRGMDLSFRRAIQCIGRHIFIHTHGAKYSQGLAAIQFGEEKGWMPKVDEKVYSWEEIPLLAEQHAADTLDSYFPIFQVNPV